MSRGLGCSWRRNHSHAGHRPAVAVQLDGPAALLLRWRPQLNHCLLAGEGQLLPCAWHVKVYSRPHCRR